MTHRLSATAAACAAAAALAAASGAAQARGFQLNERSTRALGASLAGATSAASDVTFSTFNPAALATVEGTEVGGSLSLVAPKADGEVLLTGEEVDADQAAAVPSFAAGQRVGRGVVLGLGVYSPFGLITDYEDDFIGRLDAQTSRLTAVTVAPTAAWEVADGLAIGGALDVLYADARLTNAAVALEGDTVDVGFAAGLLAEPVPGTRLGLAYQHGHDLEIEGDNTITALPGDPVFDTTAEASLPNTVTAGVTQAVTPRLRLMAEGRWIGWEDFERIDVATPDAPDLSPLGGPDFTDITERQDYEDSLFFALGGEYDATDRLTLRGGVAWDETPTTDRGRTPRVPDGDRLWLSVGASYGLGDSVTLDASYSYLHALEDPKVELLTAPTSVEYDSGAHIVSLGGTVRF